VGHIIGMTACQCRSVDRRGDLTIRQTIHKTGQEPFGFLREELDTFVRGVFSASRLNFLFGQREDITAVLVLKRDVDMTGSE
jgi:hypothetical protein